MTLKIGNRDYELHFGIEFLREIDRDYEMKVERQGVHIGLGQGLAMVYTKLATYNPVAIYDVIKAGTITEQQKPSNKDIEAFLMETDLEELVEGFFASWNENKLIMRTLALVTKEAEEEEPGQI